MRFFFLRIRRPPRSTQSRSSAASDVYKRQVYKWHDEGKIKGLKISEKVLRIPRQEVVEIIILSVSYTHLRAHETPEHLVCRLLLEKKNTYLNILNYLLHIAKQPL